MLRISTACYGQPAALHSSDECCVQAQQQAQEARAKEAAYQAALQEVTLFKSRVSAALLQAQERADSAQVGLHPKL